MADNFQHGAGFVAGGAATGTWVSVNIGGMGLSFSGTAVGLGMTPLTAVGAVTGAATYGAFRAIVEGDASAISAAAAGGLGGAGVSLSVGGMGLSFSGTAVSLGLAPITSAGAVVGLAVYGILKLFEGKGTKESSQQTFSRMEEKIGWQESYQEALLDLQLESLENKLFGDSVERQLSAWEIDDTLHRLKKSLGLDSPRLESFASVIKALQADFKLQFPEGLQFVEFESVPYTFQETQSPQKFFNHGEHSKREVAAASSAQRHQTQILAQLSKFAWCCTHQLVGEFHDLVSVAISENGQLLATGHGNGWVNLWHLMSRKHQYCFIGERKEVCALAFDSMTSTLVSGGFDCKLTTWDLPKKQFKRTLYYLNKNYSHEGFIHTIARAPDGSCFVSGGDDRKIRVWDSKTGRNLRIFNGHTQGVFTIAFHPSGDYLISGSDDQTIKIWMFLTGQCIRTIEPDSGCIYSLAIHPKREIFASGCEDGTVKIWDFESGNLCQIFEGHRKAVLSTAISPDGQTLASACSNEVKLWDLSSGQLIQTLSDANHPVTFSPDGQVLITGSYLKAIQLWEYKEAEIQPERALTLNGAWWEILQVNRTASASDVKMAYRKLASQYHPDVNSSSEAKQWMQAINQAKTQFERQNS